MKIKNVFDKHTIGMYNELTIHIQEGAMARNKYPEETKKLIVDTASQTIYGERI